MIPHMDVHLLDLHHQGVPQTIASFLVIGPEGPFLVETGPASALKMLLKQLSELGYSPADIRTVLVTHIHFDHAGSAGWWAQQGAHVYVHHLGAPHLIDPSKLVASATRIYGNEMDTLWGKVLPAPANRVSPLYDGDSFHAAGIPVKVIDSPGHARHHHVFRLENCAFVGDAAGVRLQDMPFLNVPAPPPEFDLEAWNQTIDRLLAEEFQAIYLTHFGRVDDVKEHLQAFAALLNQSATFVRQRHNARLQRNEIVAQYQEWNRQRAHSAGATDAMIHQYETANPLYMSVDGILRYWKKREGQPTSQSGVGTDSETRVN